MKFTAVKANSRKWYVGYGKNEAKEVYTVVFGDKRLSVEFDDEPQAVFLAMDLNSILEDVTQKGVE